MDEGSGRQGGLTHASSLSPLHEHTGAHRDTTEDEPMNQRIEEVMLANVKRDVARRKRHFATSVVVLSLLAVAWYVCQIEFQKLGAGLPRLWSFVVQMFPPDLSDLDVILKGAGETLAMATIGTIFATIMAFPLALMAARNTCPNKWTYRVSRAILNASRGTETFVYALVFVAAVGFGPFSGVLAITFHMVGAIGKMFAEAIEPVDQGPLDALALTGASRAKIIRYGLIPDVMPHLIASVLYIWEFSVRTSTVLGIVGAGGIGQTLKDTVDLLEFNKMITVLAVVLLMVSAIDFISDRLRYLILGTKREGFETLPANN